MSYFLQNIWIFSESPERKFKLCAVLWTTTIYTSFSIPGSLIHGVTNILVLQADHYKLATPTTALLLLKRTAEFHEKLRLPDEMSKILLLLVTSWPGRPWPLYCSPLHCWHVYHVALGHIITSHVKLIIGHVTLLLFRSLLSSQSLEWRTQHRQN